jgi:integrase/recombinase XerC
VTGTSLTRVTRAHGPLVGASRELSIDALLSAFFRGRKENTLRSYQLDLEDFAKFLRRWMSLPIGMTAREALRVFFQQGAGSANELVIHYIGDLQQRGLSSGTVNRRLAALRSVVRFGRMIGMVAWTLEVRGPSPEKVRDTRGPKADTAARLLEALAALTDRRGRRDYAMVRLMLDAGLRVSEVCGLDVADLDDVRGEVSVLGKGRRAKQPLQLPASTRQAIAAWLAVRGCHEGPLFTRSRKGAYGQAGGRLGTRSVYRQVRLRGRQLLNIRLWPHALRHTAITVAVEQARQHDIGIDEVRQFSRHKHIQTLLIYRDESRNVQGQLASLVASHLDEPDGE